MSQIAHLLLALWSDNWGGSGSASLSLSLSVSASHSEDHGGGGGHHHHHHWHDDFEYSRAGDDYWEERRKMLERYQHKPMPPRPHHVPVEKKQAEIERVVARHNFLVEEVIQIPSAQLLRDIQDELAQLALQIREYELDSDDEEAIALLLS